jgi:hypothetical protein
VPPKYKFVGKGELAKAVSWYLQWTLQRDRQKTVADKLPNAIRPLVPSWICDIQVGSRTNASPATTKFPAMGGVGKTTLTSIDEVLREIGYLGFRELDRAGREDRERESASTLRLTMGLFGGIALIVPMLIMALHPTRTTALVTTSLVTILFTVIVAFSARDSSGKDVLLVTAAYAAVFVVFVGSSLSNPQAQA